MGRHRKHRSASKQIRTQDCGNRSGCSHRNEAARLPLEQEQLDGHEHRGDRCGENRGHSGGSSGDQQCPALQGGEPEKLREQGSEGAAGHDNGAFGSERPAGSDCYRRGKRLEQSNAGLHPAVARQYRLQRLGDAVAADFFRPVPCHQPDNKAAGCRYQYGQWAEQMRGGWCQGQRKAPEENEIGDRADEADECEGDAGAGCADYDCKQHEQQHAHVACEVGQPVIWRQGVWGGGRHVGRGRNRVRVNLAAVCPAGCLSRNHIVERYNWTRHIDEVFMGCGARNPGVPIWQTGSAGRRRP